MQEKSTKPPKPPRPTIKSLQEELKQSQLRTASAHDRAQAESTEKYRANAALKAAEEKIRCLEFAAQLAAERETRLTLMLTEEDARAEAFEFVLRLQHGAPVLGDDAAPLRELKPVSEMPPDAMFRR